MFEKAVIDYVAQITTIAGFLLAMFGYFNEVRKRRDIERRERIRVWSDIAKMRALMTDLEKPLDSKGYDFGKHQAVGKLTSMFRDKIATVFEITKNVSMADVNLWRKNGKICSDWQEACFWECFPQESLVDCEITSLNRGLDELPNNHSMAARPTFGQ